MPGAAIEVFDMTICRAGESLKQLCQMVGATDVAIEAPLFLGEGSNSHTIAALMQLTGALRCVAKMQGCAVALYGSSTVRRTFVGRGNMKKAEAEAAVQARCDLLGWTYLDHNHADANAVWAHAMAVRYPAWAPCSTPLFGKAVA